jgi:hypothetical protein
MLQRLWSASALRLLSRLLKNVHLPFDWLTALSFAEGLRCAASLVIAAYGKARLIPSDWHALQLIIFEQPVKLWGRRCRPN